MEIHRGGLTPSNALELVQQYDIVIDASDNAPTRYLASDACVVAGKPLVSGAALGTDGQLTVYNHEDGELSTCELLLSLQLLCNRFRAASAARIIGSMQACASLQHLHLSFLMQGNH